MKRAITAAEAAEAAEIEAKATGDTAVAVWTGAAAGDAWTAADAWANWTAAVKTTTAAREKVRKILEKMISDYQ